MRLTNKELKRIIKEEIQKVLNEREDFEDTPCKRVSDYYNNFKPRSGYHKQAAVAAQRIYKRDGAGAERALRGMVSLVKAMKKDRKPGVEPEAVQQEFWDSVTGTYQYIQDLGSDACHGFDARAFPSTAGEITGSENVKALLIMLMPPALSEGRRRLRRLKRRSR